ncbi:hypothetical protein BCR41DRAFT_359950 [Lobosporangium transversale]|uniref:Uncharacterized protein n=1 Tax=Lobosporangium transversale TaxID=64571 RepID=A0A1Y2GDA5_9FUNG|nr:hypothetical protein BCR41DRAFT_359950 [Lobosporangium transversale]ORZ07707.1 hypothetical protein BCR41DRAFT_359950 [Lobosporangium transversale]|eukprot:XP_021878073.1 hypothetical protein BCR41DRAFT_359950 [Lobosporangium transversale]
MERIDGLDKTIHEQKNIINALLERIQSFDAQHTFRSSPSTQDKGKARAEELRIVGRG